MALSYEMKRGVDYIGVGVGAIIVDERGRLFFARRGPSAKNERGRWEAPGQVPRELTVITRENLEHFVRSRGGS